MWVKSDDQGGQTERPATIRLSVALLQVSYIDQLDYGQSRVPNFEKFRRSDRIGSWKFFKFPKRIALDRRGADRFGSDRRIAKVFGRFLPIFRRFLPYFADYNNL